MELADVMPYLVAGGKIIALIAVIVVASYLSDATKGIIRRGTPNDTLRAVRDKLTHLRAKLSRSRRKNNKERTK